MMRVLSPVEDEADDRTCESIDSTIDDEKHAGLRKIMDHMLNNAILNGVCSCWLYKYCTMLKSRTWKEVMLNFFLT